MHGGPGAAGEMAPLARMLAEDFGVLEPLQTASTVDGQLKELRRELKKAASFPVTLVGFSWGAWLSFLYTASYPDSVKKLILISSGSFTEEYAPLITETRLERMTEDDMSEFKSLVASFDTLPEEKKPQVQQRFVELFSKSDSFDPLPFSNDVYPDIEFNAHIFQSVWPEASELRRSGKLISYAEHIRCPVVAIHGDYDPHPAEGVKTPLTEVLEDFRFFLLEKCGHTPWAETHARDAFIAVLSGVLRG
ncbi:alpha/beta fold hydrolase [Candidatus Latescibacterota bacterium]